MINKTLLGTLTLITATFLTVSFFSCNNGTEQKEDVKATTVDNPKPAASATKDTIASKVDSTPKAAPAKLDSAAAVTPALKKGDIKQLKPTSAASTTHKAN